MKADSESVIDFVKSILRFDGVLSQETELFLDLGLMGDDVDMFFLAFEDKYGVKCSGVDFDEYFYMAEGLPLLWANIRHGEQGSRRLKSIKLRDLVEAIKCKDLKLALQKSAA